MKIFLRYFCFCALLLVLLFIIANYTSNADYILIEKEIAAEDSLATRDLEYFKLKHGKDRKAMLFYHLMRARLLTQQGEEVSIDSTKYWVNEAKQTGDSLLYAKSLEALATFHAARGEHSQALSAQQRAYDVVLKADAASALRERHVIVTIAVLLVIAVALCMTYLHLFKQEKTRGKHKDLRLSLANKQLQLSAQNTEQFLFAIEELRKKVKENNEASSEATMTRISESMTNELISFKKQQITLSLISLTASEIAERLGNSVTDRRIRISEKDWIALTELFSQQLPQLITLLQTNGAVTVNERRICMLTLLDMGTLETGAILNLQSSSVSSAKKSLLQKLTGDAAASAKDLKTKIISILTTL